VVRRLVTVALARANEGVYAEDKGANFSGVDTALAASEAANLRH
jgi:hypothetical protein